ncbi:MerC domain-containing protein [Wenzhouxiangella marina]|uniref:Uncharacterized protein n=1 Tax=Wenzhouxiangella marina TaxID=1579979 RepID=A0A0K0XSY6_9GAMM|nr:MerC domain-containing protein [Wenzhouxiangella marina]AKS40731.1 hypothetical protein WM2015_348 [Wenzhouxiangella marina]MBB6087604.1 hypothetical protein [Wenzhouxiangella marina]
MAAVFKPNPPNTDAGSALDRAGICVSAVCLVQCLLLPVLVLVSPLGSLGFFGEEAFHWLLWFLILPISMAAFGLGFRQHGNRRMLVLGGLGLALVSFSTFFGHELLGTLGTALVTSLGGGLLITGHWLNLRQRRRYCLRTGD